MFARSRSRSADSSATESDTASESFVLRGGKKVFRNPLKAVRARIHERKEQKLRSKSQEPAKYLSPFRRPRSPVMAEAGCSHDEATDRLSGKLTGAAEDRSELYKSMITLGRNGSQKVSDTTAQKSSADIERDKTFARMDVLLDAYEAVTSKNQPPDNDDNEERSWHRAPSPTVRSHAGRLDKEEQSAARSRVFYDQSRSTKQTEKVARIADSVIAPRPFYGRPDDDVDPEEWLVFFGRYAEHKGWDERQCKQALELMLRGPAQDWLLGLDEKQTSTLASLIEAFEKTFLKSPELRWLEAQQMFTKTQAPNENVSAYVIRLRKIAKRVNADDETLKHAFVAGLKPELRMQVLLKGNKTFEQALETAKLAEASGSGDPLTALLEEQIRSSARAAEKQSAEMRELAARVDKLAVAVTSTEQYAINAVGNENRTQRAVVDTSPRDDHVRNDYSSNRQLKDTPQNRQRANYGREAGLQNQQMQQPQQWNNQGGNQTPGRGLQQQNTTTQGQGCPNCGLIHRTTCFARGQQCRNCGKVGHFARCCRSSRAPQPQNN